MDNPLAGARIAHDPVIVSAGSIFRRAPKARAELPADPAMLMVLGVGVATTSTYEVKRLDTDFFEEE